MIYIAYCSAALTPMTSLGLADLLRQSYRNNQRDGVTGMLLYHSGSFMQFLEGDDLAVQKTYSKICGDERHQGVVRLAHEPIWSRSFDRWSMGFLDTKDLLPDDRSVHNTFLEKNVVDSDYADGEALRLLVTFKDVMDRTKYSARTHRHAFKNAFMRRRAPIGRHDEPDVRTAARCYGRGVMTFRMHRYRMQHER